ARTLFPSKSRRTRSRTTTRSKRPTKPSKQPENRTLASWKSYSKRISPHSWSLSSSKQAAICRSFAGDLLVSPLSRWREREGPSAKQWEGEGPSVVNPRRDLPHPEQPPQAAPCLSKDEVRASSKEQRGPGWSAHGRALDSPYDNPALVPHEALRLGLDAGTL